MYAIVKYLKRLRVMSLTGRSLKVTDTMKLAERHEHYDADASTIRKCNVILAMRQYYLPGFRKNSAEQMKSLAEPAACLNFIFSNPARHRLPVRYVEISRRRHFIT